MNEYSFKVRLELNPLASSSQSSNLEEPDAYHAALAAMRRFSIVGGNIVPAGDGEEVSATIGEFTAHVRYTGGKESAMPSPGNTWPMIREEDFVVRIERKAK